MSADPSENALSFDVLTSSPVTFQRTREWRNRQTRTVQVRVPVMGWGFNSPLAHQFSRKILRETQCIMRDEAAALSYS